MASETNGPVRAPTGHKPLISWLVIASICCFIGGLIITGLATRLAYYELINEARANFSTLAERVKNDCKDKLDMPYHQLLGARGLFAASKSVEKNEFKAFYDSLDVKKELPGVLGLEFIQRVKRDEAEEYVRRVRLDDAPDFHIRSTSNKSDLYVIKFAEPQDVYEAVSGYDVGAEPRRRKAMEDAIATGESVSTSCIDFVPGLTDDKGYLFIVPVFKNGTNPKTPAQRLAALDGLLIVPISVDKALGNHDLITHNMLDVEVFDDVNRSTAATMVANDDTTEARARLFNTYRKITVGSRQWIVHLSTKPAFEAAIEYSPVRNTAFFGVLLTVLVTMVIWSLGRANKQAMAIAKKMTVDLENSTAAAQSANRAKSEFLANMSHEIRTPLTAILGYADLLRNDETFVTDRAKRAETIDTIRTAGQHLMTIINDILDLSKIEAGKMSIENINTPIAQILMEVSDLMTPRARGKGLEFDIKLTTPIPDQIMSDPTRVRQILMNLVGNAVKFTEEGRVSVRVLSKNVNGADRLVVEIEDTGVGLKEAIQNRLFQSFNQADSTVTRTHGGTGLGLVICKRLANLLQGNVKLVRSEENQGSCFEFELPLIPHPQAKMIDTLTRQKIDNVKNSDQIPLSGRILLAEDGPENRILVGHFIKKMGLQIEMAENGKIALEMIENNDRAGTPYDLLLTDMQMPEMDGYTLASILRDRRHPIPIVALTAHAMAEDRDKCLNAGCHDYLSKPVDRNKLYMVCAMWIENGKDVLKKAA